MLQSYSMFTFRCTSICFLLVVSFYWSEFAQSIFAYEQSQIDDIVSRLDTADGLKCSLFAAEPDVVNPSAIDVDHRGRVWVCEIVNYRHRQGSRLEGDRIVILQDNDADGRADESKVFYQGNDINSPHGVCVLGTLDGRGTRAIVSAGSRIVMLIDDDGDDRADRQKDLFTGIQGVQEDHGIHAVVLGPDGRLYFNCGNAAEVIRDSRGMPIRDLTGNLVNSERNPYQQGMAFRCNLDGTGFETLAWNFRNPWMLTVDSFGNVWQSDNDDDGYRSCRINFLAEYGNYGYQDELTGASWREWRTGQHPDLPFRHWHVNDPGTMPSVVYTGSGSPAGITVYEGKLLARSISGQLVHCDPGHGVVRSYQLTPQGAGYQAHASDLVVGTRAPWFRPVDAKVAPDGSLIIADWNDAGVGGHQIADLKQGRIFRLTPAIEDSSYPVPSYDFNSVAGAVDALANPNFAMRAVAWKRLRSLGHQAAPLLENMVEKGGPLLSARALWVLGVISGTPNKFAEQAIKHDDPRVRIVGLRLARQHQLDILPLVKKLRTDPSPQVQRELALSLAHDHSPRAVRLWAELASQYQGSDRWLLEALGIGARGKWNECLVEWMTLVGEKWSTPPLTDIVWRSRATRTARLLTELILSASSRSENSARYLRALDFQQKQQASKSFSSLLNHNPLPSPEVIVESLERQHEFKLNENPSAREAIETYLAEHQGSTRYHSLIRRFDLTDHTQELRDQLAATVDSSNTRSSTNSVEAARTLLVLIGPNGLLAEVESLGVEQRPKAIVVLGKLNNKQINQRLRAWLVDESAPLKLQKAAVKGLSKSRSGLLALLDVVRQGELPNHLKFSVSEALYGHYDESIIDQAKKLLPPLQLTGKEDLPPLFHLVRERGDSNRGKQVFEKTGTCAKCHRVNGVGREVGPDLSEIGSKLSREAQYQAILDPSAGISPNFEQYVVVLDSGISSAGLKISETDDAVTLRNNEGIDTTFSKHEVEDFRKSDHSLMPAGLEQLMSRKEIVDLVEYLMTLKKR